MNQETLLTAFIAHKLEAYEEPTRKGTPRGISIGYPSSKYHTTLLALTRAKQKDIARMVGVSHGLIRKWASEANFRVQVAQHRKEFARFHVENIYRRISDYKARLDETLQEEFPTMPQMGFDEYTDADLYDDETLMTIGEAIRDEIRHSSKKYNDIDALMFRIAAFKVCFALIPSLREATAEEFKGFRSEVGLALIDSLRQMLQQRRINSRDKRIALVLLDGIAEDYSSKKA